MSDFIGEQQAIIAIGIDEDAQIECPKCLNSPDRDICDRCKGIGFIPIGLETILGFISQISDGVRLIDLDDIREELKETFRK